MQNFVYKINEDESYTIIGYSGDEAEVTIPNFGGNVKVIFDNVFRDHPEIRSVIFPPTLTDIGSFVFDGCDGLRTVTLPDGLLNLWQYAFRNSSIEEIEIPASVRNLIPFTFKDCKKLRRVVCHPSMKKLCTWAFQGCSQLETIVVGENTVIEHEAFLGCNPDLKIERCGE